MPAATSNLEDRKAQLRRLTFEEIPYMGIFEC
jgi:hypothetical protein